MLKVQNVGHYFLSSNFGLPSPPSSNYYFPDNPKKDYGLLCVATAKQVVNSRV